MYYLKDHLGSTVGIASNTGQLRDVYRYRPFGASWYDAVQTGDMFNYTGQLKDQELNHDLYYYGARFYDPILKIFTQVDPLDSKYPGWSPYVYTLNNPVRLVDPNGEQAVSAREIAYAAKHPQEAAQMLRNVRVAGKMAADSDLKGRSNGPQDAYRHALWSAMNARDFGLEMAEEIGALHERGSGDAAATEMDMHNNQAGFEIGMANATATDAELGQHVLTAYSEGKLQTEKKEDVQNKLAAATSTDEYYKKEVKDVTPTNIPLD